MSLVAVGETSAPVLRSTAYSMDVGFARSHPPPREVQQVGVLWDKETLVWTPERSVGTYRVYRGDLDGLPADYGVCRSADVTGQQVQLQEFPEIGQAFFYLLTAENTLLEEGITGYDSAGVSRATAVPCP